MGLSWASATRRTVTTSTLLSGRVELVELTAVEQRRTDRGAGGVGDASCSTPTSSGSRPTNPAVNAIVALDPDVGRRRALDIDAAIARGDDPGPLAGLVTAHKDLTETEDFPTTYGSPLFAGYRPTGRQPARRPHARGRRGGDRQDELARVRCRLAHVQLGVRDDAQPVGARSLGRRLERRRRGRAGVPDGRHGGRQRHRRVVAQPGGVEQRDRLPADCAPSCRRSAPAMPGCRSAPRARWGARSTTSPCCSACSAHRTLATRCTSPSRSQCR